MKKVVLIFLFCMLCSLTLYSSNEQLLSSIERKYQNFTTFEASIMQENYFSQINYTLESTGTVLMQNDSIVIEYTDPFYQFIKLVNGELTLYSQLENTAIISRDGEMFSQALLHFSNMLNHELRFMERDGNLVVFHVQRPIASVQNMKIFINENSELIESVTYSEDANNIVTIRFLDQRFNQSLSRNIDSFNIPSGTEIIRQ
ncbi:MAG: outer membrane lipoprotein carrier protein LolA [Candidatus Cloacimonetes bacterium]|nr:outer membrane lipoprotein carrier protein LolA [Candidatus Cloacimonadota bacterium]